MLYHIGNKQISKNHLDFSRSTRWFSSYRVLSNLNFRAISCLYISRCFLYFPSTRYSRLREQRSVLFSLFYKICSLLANDHMYVCTVCCICTILLCPTVITAVSLFLIPLLFVSRISLPFFCLFVCLFYIYFFTLRFVYEDGLFYSKQQEFCFLFFSIFTYMRLI